MKDYRLVVVDSPMSIFADQELSQLMGKVFQIKFASYNEVHAHGVIPADKSDFFGTHLIVCQEEGGKLEPIFAYRSVSWARCEQHHFEFPAWSVVRQDASTEHQKSMGQLLGRYAYGKERISWDSAWAQDPLLRTSKSPEQKNEFRQITMAVGCLHHLRAGITHMVTLGTLKVKTDVFFANMGLAPLIPQGKFAYSAQFGSEVEIYHGDQFSPFALECADRYQSLWDNRLVFDGSQAKPKKVAA